jgi:hypothetical protein
VGMGMCVRVRGECKYQVELGGGVACDVVIMRYSREYQSVSTEHWPVSLTDKQSAEKQRTIQG